ncbi:hypothetical protein IWQ56_005544 [Coemansia nantahalensis]|uniref:Uncharacterized protein n=2 Tax=Coemansia TaxID=4863 RepID=A0ACC1KDP1_9FUNG|nr:hypothetical protein IWQ56_005544 [Coemansia nantahalensis]KAJ2769844.1 hypothetical protein IWQ57_002931 [Coemansia nantahalensis]KAJ2787970.1 hypothetical protein H4R21_007068 [Coemansia helicoidea]
MAEKQSTRGSGARKGAQKYQNTFAYKHNPKSKKTQTILALPVDGLCRRCTDQINWRKQYRKYKPLTVAKKCVSCELKKVKKAYHVLCDDCAGAKGVCAKCAEKAEIVDDSAAAQQDSAAAEQEIECKLAGMRERERRTCLRKLERGDITAADIPDRASDDSGSDFSDSGDGDSGDESE